MIRLDGNSLAAFRGAGVAGTVQRMAGCLVHEASPYSEAATAALKAQFPTQWPTIRDYGFSHPEIVPYVNANPLCAAIWCCYVQDGLVFQMDCNYECTAAKWKDVRSALEFIGTNVQILDGVPYFSGSSAKYQNTASTLAFNYGAVTLEIVYKATVDNSGSNRKFFGVKGGTVSYGALSNNRGIICSDGSCQQFPYITNAQFTRASVYSDSYAYFNGIAKVASGGNSWGDENKNFIGNGGSWNGYAGRVYAIRIYNRKLTEQEILANQAIDLQRWQPA